MEAGSAYKVPIDVRECAITCSIEGLGRVEIQVTSKIRARDGRNKRVLCARAQRLVAEFTVAEDKRTLTDVARATHAERRGGPKYTEANVHDTIDAIPVPASRPNARETACSR
jgi:hypothetical protein